MTLWSLDELTTLGPIVPHGASVELGGVSIDSRQIQAGDLFIALSGDPGPRFNGGVDNPRDGHDFIENAVSAGAGAVLLSKPPEDMPVPYIQVDDTLDGMWALGSLARQRTQAKVVAITGSAGKTTAKSWLSQCLRGQAKVHSSEGSLNNHWGVPLSLCRMSQDTEVGIIEIGTNHPGEIAPLCALAEPDVSVLLNVLPAHIGNFPSFEALRKEKLSIASGLRPGGKFVLPRSLASGDPSEVTFGFEPDADVTGTYRVDESGWHIDATVAGERIHYQLKEGGEHRVLTSLAVLAVVSCLNLSAKQASANLVSQDSPVGRGNQTKIAGITVIDDSYNANPVSMIYALENLLKQQTSSERRTIALLGEILELGNDSAKYHREVAEQFTGIDTVITVGEGFAVAPGDQHLDSIEQLDLDAWVSDLRPGDQILVKGSNKVFWKHNFVQRLVRALQGDE